MYEDIATRNRRIVKECEERGEPYFVIRGQDALAPSALSLLVDHYYTELDDPDDDEVSTAIEANAALIHEWQQQNPDVVKNPDLREVD